MMESRTLRASRLLGLGLIIGSMLSACADTPPVEAPEAPVVEQAQDLWARPPASDLTRAVDALEATDPDVSITWFRGHVDQYNAQPKATPPDFLATTRSLIVDVPEPLPPERPEGETFERPSGPDDVDIDATVPAAAPFDIGTVLEDDVTWYPQEGRTLVRPVLTAFLTKHQEIFELPEAALEAGLPDLQLREYGVGKDLRRAVFTQKMNGVPVLDSKTVVLFDKNWNVVVISRQLHTTDKVKVVNEPRIDESEASLRAFEALAAEREDFSAAEAFVVDATMGIDVIRARYAWSLTIRARGDDLVVLVDADDGDILALKDVTARYGDAQVSVYMYSNGNYTTPYQTTRSGIYTHDDNSLVHDFFYIVNDDRNNGGTGTCNATSPSTNTTPDAYGTRNSATHIRPTLRSDRNFTLWQPSAPKGSFGESHVYYWARRYVQWQKQSLVDNGLLTLGSFKNYKKALLIVNACTGGAGVHNPSFKVSTYQDKGENINTIRFPDRCRSGLGSPCTTAHYRRSSDYWYTYLGDAGYSAPGVISHELNHFLMQAYLGAANSRDCSSDEELKFFQEGGLGRTLPQMFWHSVYSIGYNPSDKDRLFRGKLNDSGMPHDPSNSSTFETLSDWPCTSSADPYDSGLPVHQVLWKIYHGKKITSTLDTTMNRPASDTWMLRSAYWAADLTAASTRKDRKEYANRFMQFWDTGSRSIASTRRDWCDVWQAHGFNRISSSYCN